VSVAARRRGVVAAPRRVSVAARARVPPLTRFAEWFRSSNISSLEGRVRADGTDRSLDHGRSGASRPRRSFRLGGTISNMKLAADRLRAKGATVQRRRVEERGVTGINR
jgi:hypothetical protein